MDVVENPGNAKSLATLKASMSGDAVKDLDATVTGYNVSAHKVEPKTPSDAATPPARADSRPPQRAAGEVADKPKPEAASAKPEPAADKPDAAVAAAQAQAKLKHDRVSVGMSA